METVNFVIGGRAFSTAGSRVSAPGSPGLAREIERLAGPFEDRGPDSILRAAALVASRRGEQLAVVGEV